MLRLAFASFLAPVLLALAPGGAPDAIDTPAAAQIDSACAGDVDQALHGAPRSFARVFGSFADGRWHPLVAATTQRIARDPNIYSEVAQAWQVDDSVVLVQISARSLELRAESSYCFRRSGTLARVVESSTGTEVRDDEARYFDEGGTRVARHSAFYALTPGALPTISPDFKPSTPTLYLSVHDLPFL